MPDNREAILARLAALAAAVTGVVHVGRNIERVNDTQLPAIVILEGDEDADDNDPPRRGQPGPRRVRMTPQVVLCVADPSEQVGASLNTLRSGLISSVLNDATLRSLTLDEAVPRYDGLVTDLGLGRAMIGQMALRFTFTYVLRP